VGHGARESDLRRSDRHRQTHLAIALGVEATRQKRRVLFTRAADLVRQLLEARDARELTRLQQRLLRVDVLIVDELGFVPSVVVVNGLFAMLREFARSIAMAVRQLRGQMQREIDDERNPP
jgi:chromosomal replication initiation ATPase DnaA